MKHTPGPWFVVEGDEWTSNIATDTPEQGIWTVADANSRRAEFQANRKLIAAAPDLLEALERILAERGEEYGDCDYQCLWKAIEDAKPALAKAKQQ